MILQQLVQKAVCFPAVPSGKFTKSGIVIKLTVPLRDGSRRKYGSNVLVNYSYMGEPFYFSFVYSCPQEGVTCFPFPVECFPSFSNVLQIITCQAISFWSPNVVFALKFTILSQLLEKNFKIGDCSPFLIFHSKGRI